MGAAASVINKDEIVALTADELATTIASFGEEYAVYKDAIISENLTGKKISSLSKDEQIAALKRIGISDDTLLNVVIEFVSNMKLEQASCQLTSAAISVSDKNTSGGAVILVGDNEKFKKLIQSPQLTVVDFTAKWFVDHASSFSFMSSH